MFFQHVKITSSLWAVTFLWTSASFKAGCTSRNLFTRSDLAQNDLKILVHEEELQNVTLNSHTGAESGRLQNSLKSFTMKGPCWHSQLVLIFSYLREELFVFTSLHLCLYIFVFTLLSLHLCLLLSMVTNCWTVPILPTPLLLFSINISIRGYPSFITIMNTIKNSMAESLVRFLSEGETMLGFSFHGKEVKSE